MTERPVGAGPASECCSASRPARLRTAFWYALTGTWSAALQPLGPTTGASAPLKRSASCLALVTA
jgi:hypothetical protein